MLNCLPSPVAGTCTPKKGSSPSEERPVRGAHVALRTGGGGGGGGGGGAIHDTKPGYASVWSNKHSQQPTNEPVMLAQAMELHSPPAAMQSSRQASGVAARVVLVTVPHTRVPGSSGGMGGAADGGGGGATADAFDARVRFTAA